MSRSRLRTLEAPVTPASTATYPGRFLIGDSLGAKTDLEKSLDLVPSFVQSWVKIASVHMELGEWERS